jgi:hypothetical protein
VASLIYPNAFADQAVPQKASLLTGFVQSMIHVTGLAASKEEKNIIIIKKPSKQMTLAMQTTEIAPRSQTK